jgi:hypothetical protein
MNSSNVNAMTVYNGELYVGGTNITKWNGTMWSTVANSNTAALCVYNGDLYAGGTFDTINGITSNLIAKWNGTTWDSVGNGLTGGNGIPIVTSLASYNGNLYAGGLFANAGGNPAKNIAKWNGIVWDSVGTGISGGNDPHVYALNVYNSELFAGGVFTTAGNNSAYYIARWNLPVGIKENTQHNGISVFPNPSSGKLIINSNSIMENSILSIYNALGRSIFHSEIKNMKIEIDLSFQPKGIYFYQIQTKEGNTENGKIMIQ